jgi:hypothetical protein
MLEKKMYNMTVHQLFIDFKKAYDSVRSEVLYNILIEFGVSKKLVRLIKMCLNETYRKVRIGKHLSDSSPIQNGLRQGDALSPLIFNFALKYAIRKIQENQVGLKLNGTHQLLAYADDVNLQGDTIKTTTEMLIDASKEVGLEINVEKTKYVYVAVLSPECRSKSGHKSSKQIIWKSVTVQIFGDNSNKSKFDSGGN